MEGDSRADGRTAEARRYGGTWRWTLDVIVTIVLLISCLHSWFGSSSGVPSQQQLRLCVSQPQLRRFERRALVAMEPGLVRPVASPQIADPTQQTAAQQAALSEAQQQQQQQQQPPISPSVLRAAAEHHDGREPSDDVTMGENQDQRQQQQLPTRRPAAHDGPPLGIYVSTRHQLGSYTWASSDPAGPDYARTTSACREHVCSKCRALWVIFYPPGGFAPQGWHAGNQREIWPTVRRSYGECSYCHVVWRFEALHTPAPPALVWSPVPAATPAPLPSRVTLQTPTRSRPWSLPCRLEE